ncbi:hypothetical protein Tco_0771481 [Tanacetum coccineum]|uniref:Reverse transcriptase Ty1/copia-type domain-containing protein n=1 Tax=Tanacetum coccineum TaxID=301880 RepID=A0ABQ4ZFF5_9ASTR
MHQKSLLLFLKQFTEHAVSTGSPSSTTVDQDAPSPSNSPTTQGTQTPIISHDVEEDNHDIEVAHMGNDPYFVSEHNSKWTKDHPLENIIGALDRPVSTRLQLHEQALFCYYDAFLTSVEPKNYKEALTQACWIEAMQEELHEFERQRRFGKLVPSSDESILSFLLSGSISQHVNGFVEPDNLTTYTSLRKLLYWVETAPRACMICLSSFQISNDFSKRLSGSYTLLIFPRKATELILGYSQGVEAPNWNEDKEGNAVDPSPLIVICRSCWLSRYTSSTICAVYNFGERLVSWIVTLKGKKSAAKSRDNESAIALMLQQAHVQQFQIKADRHPFHFIKEPKDAFELHAITQSKIRLLLEIAYGRLLLDRLKIGKCNLPLKVRYVTSKGSNPSSGFKINTRNTSSVISKTGTLFKQFAPRVGNKKFVRTTSDKEILIFLSTSLLGHSGDIMKITDVISINLPYIHPRGSFPGCKPQMFSDEGTGVTPGVLDAPDYDSKDDISCKSSDNDQADEQAE